MNALGDLLGNVGEPDDIAVNVLDDGYTRRELEAEAESMAAALAALGVAPGSPVAVSLPNGAEVIAALFGVWSLGAVYVPVNPRLVDDEIGRMFAIARPAAVITTPDAAQRFGALPVLAGRFGAWEGRPAVNSGAEPPMHHGDTIALVQMTSGTTGRPKPVLLEHEGVLKLLDAVIGKLRAPGAGSGAATGAPGAGDAAKRPMPNLIPVSLSLWAGIYQVLFAFRVGAAIVILPRFETKAFAAAVKRFGIRSTVLPPPALTMLADDAEIDDLAPLRYVRSISSPLSPLQARRFRDRFGISVLNGYGQTEIGGEIVGWGGSDSKAFGETKLGSVGRPHPGVSLRVMGPDGAELGVDEPGELWVLTPALSAGYADGAAIADRLSADGWFRTGDIARIDPDGFVWIEGRVSDMINRGGLKVFPAEVTEVLRLSDQVADAAVVGIPDDRLGEVPWAFVVPAGERVDEEVLEQLCRKHLAPYKVPVHFSVIDALPRNEIGKVLAGELVARGREEASR